MGGSGHVGHGGRVLNGPVTRQHCAALSTVSVTANGNLKTRLVMAWRLPWPQLELQGRAEGQRAARTPGPHPPPVPPHGCSRLWGRGAVDAGGPLAPAQSCGSRGWLSPDLGWENGKFNFQELVGPRVPAHRGRAGGPAPRAAPQICFLMWGFTVRLGLCEERVLSLKERAWSRKSRELASPCVRWVWARAPSPQQSRTEPQAAAPHRSWGCRHDLRPCFQGAHRPRRTGRWGWVWGVSPGAAL